MYSDSVFLYYYTDSFKSEIYIGANDIAVEGTWRWVDGSLVDKTVFVSVYLNNEDNDFPKSDPVRRLNADCGFIWEKLKLRDDNCDFASYYVCELSW